VILKINSFKQVRSAIFLETKSNKHVREGKKEIFLPREEKRN